MGFIDCFLKVGLGVGGVVRFMMEKLNRKVEFRGIGDIRLGWERWNWVIKGEIVFLGYENCF